MGPPVKLQQATSSYQSQVFNNKLHDKLRERSWAAGSISSSGTSAFCACNTTLPFEWPPLTSLAVSCFFGIGLGAFKACGRQIDIPSLPGAQSPLIHSRSAYHPDRPERLQYCKVSFRATMGDLGSSKIRSHLAHFDTSYYHLFVLNHLNSQFPPSWPSKWLSPTWPSGTGFLELQPKPWRQQQKLRCVGSVWPQALGYNRRLHDFCDFGWFGKDFCHILHMKCRNSIVHVDFAWCS